MCTYVSYPPFAKGETDVVQKTNSPELKINNIE